MSAPEATALAEETTRLRQDLASAKAGEAAAQTLTERLATAEARVDQLLTLLAAGGTDEAGGEDRGARRR